VIGRKLSMETGAKVADNSGAPQQCANTTAGFAQEEEAPMSSSAPNRTTSGRSPAFQFYPKDFLTDENVVVMSLAERGAYITLICQCWIDGTIPADVARLARMCGTPLSAFRKLWPALERCFTPARNGSERLVHPRLEKERKKQAEYRARQAENGAKGGRPHKPTANPTLTDTKGLASFGVTQTEPKKSSSSLSSSSSSDSSQTHERVRAFPTPREKSEPDAVEMRAGRFCEEVYPALYAKFRKGARYVGKPVLDYQEAVALCRTWDDERLAKIAQVFLTTDHQFAESGSRTMAQFRSLASWCDAKLIEAGIA
jgi:uncharacterized protein YdaU (DUF1376 family)